MLFFVLTFTDIHIDRQKVPKSFFDVKNQPKFPELFFIEDYKIRSVTFINDIF